MEAVHKDHRDHYYDREDHRDCHSEHENHRDIRTCHEDHRDCHSEHGSHRDSRNNCEETLNKLCRVKCHRDKSKIGDKCARGYRKDELRREPTQDLSCVGVELDEDDSLICDRICGPLPVAKYPRRRHPSPQMCQVNHRNDHQIDACPPAETPCGVPFSLQILLFATVLILILITYIIVYRYRLESFTHNEAIPPPPNPNPPNQRGFSKPTDEECCHHPPI